MPELNSLDFFKEMSSWEFQFCFNWMNNLGDKVEFRISIKKYLSKIGFPGILFCRLIQSRHVFLTSRSNPFFFHFRDYGRIHKVKISFIRFINKFRKFGPFSLSISNLSHNRPNWWKYVSHFNKTKWQNPLRQLFFKKCC